MPLILVKSPATYTVSGVGPGSSCWTSPSTVGLNVWLTSPVVASNANRFCRAYGVPFIGSATWVNRPPAIIVLPTWTTLLTSPSRIQGVFLLGTSPGIRSGAGGATAAAGAAVTDAAAPDATAPAGTDNATLAKQARAARKEPGRRRLT